MRHAESEYNKAESKNKANNCPISEIDLLFSLDQNIIDPNLTQTGINQATESGPIIAKNFPNIKYWIVSPARRTFQTMLNAFQNYPLGFHPENIKICPLVAEPCNQSSDSFFKTNENFLIRPDISFDFMKQYENPEIWFIHNIHESGDQSLKNELIKNWKDNKNPEKIIGLMKENYPKRFASDNKAIRGVIEQAQDMLKKLCVDKKIGDNEVIVITHSSILKGWTANSFDQECNPVGYKNFKNCEVFSIEL